MKTMYEGVMIVLVMLTIITLWTDSAYNSTINLIVWLVFFIDFLTQLLGSKDKWDFIKHNPFLIIAIIPFDQFFQVARIVRLIYFFRIKTIAKYYITPYVKKVSYQSLTWIVPIILLLLLAESMIVWKLESSISTYFEAMYVVFSHLFFLGHRVFIIGHPFLIWVLTITSILGVVMQGLALQWAFTKLETFVKKVNKRRDSYRAG